VQIAGLHPGRSSTKRPQASSALGGRLCAYQHERVAKSCRTKTSLLHQTRGESATPTKTFIGSRPSCPTTHARAVATLPLRVARAHLQR
jgi:hypothetical protein